MQHSRISKKVRLERVIARAEQRERVTETNL